MSPKLTRRDSLKTMGLLLGGTFFPWSAHARNEAGEPFILPDPETLFTPAARPITAITLGAGARGNTYGNFALAYPDQIDIVGVAEPIPIRNERYAAAHGIPDEHRFETWEHVFERRSSPTPSSSPPPTTSTTGPAWPPSGRDTTSFWRSPSPPRRRSAGRSWP
jgi:hypothetical protein